MDDSRNEINSCVMLAINLDLPVDLRAVFDSSDLKDTGIELDSHITLLYAAGKEIPRHNIIRDIQEILGDPDFGEFMKICENGDSEMTRALDAFELGSFENDSDYIVLKLKKETKLFGFLERINKGLSEKYDISTEFKSYTPHITLVELNPGTAKKYLDSDKLLLILDETYFAPEDIMISYGTSNEVEDRRQYFLTTFSCVDRYFRLKNLKESNKEPL